MKCQTAEITRRPQRPGRRAERIRMRLMRIVIFMPLMFTGCASVISSKALEQVDQSIRFEQLLENPAAYEGRTVLLGGEIIEAQNLEEKTLLIVVQRPLCYRDKPCTDGDSAGRFIVSTPDFLDPAIFRTGRKITVVGSVAGKDVRPLDEIEYSYPVISERELYLWPSEEYDTQPRLYFGIGVGKSF
jgi:outer membrane lipoprotein